jgi:hypothetical protein
MKRWTMLAAAPMLVALCLAVSQSRDRSLAQAAPSEKEQPMLAHNVFFTLKDSSHEARQKLIDACKKYLADHPGTVFFAAGEVSDLDRDVNVLDFDVGLHLIFVNRAAHDAYQVAPTHLQFIEENKESWKQVRVFDTDVKTGGA